MELFWYSVPVPSKGSLSEDLKALSDFERERVFYMLLDKPRFLIQIRRHIINGENIPAPS